MASETKLPKITPIEEELQSTAQLEVYKEGKAIKEEADNLFRQDKPQEALAKYYQVKLRWKGLNRQGVPGATGPLTKSGESEDPKAQSQLNLDLEKLYSNMSACFFKQKKWQRAIDTANEALALNKDNTKALFRKAKGLGELGFFEKAEPILTELIKKNPSDVATLKEELEKLRTADAERQKKADKKLKGFLNSRRGIFDEKTAPTITHSTPDAEDSEPGAARIEEVSS